MTTSLPCILLLTEFPKYHHLYVDDTQLFSFHSLEFDSSISHLQNALQQMSSWMTANLLTLNSSKTEFLLIGLKNQLAKIHNASLDTSQSARNLGFIIDEHLTFSDQITSLSKACYYLIHQLCCNGPYLDSSTACSVPLLPLSFNPNLITVILSTINSPSLNYPVSNRSRTLARIAGNLLQSVQCRMLLSD